MSKRKILANGYPYGTATTVAAQLNLSVSYVKRVLRNPCVKSAYISKGVKTRTKILRAAEKHRNKVL